MVQLKYSPEESLQRVKLMMGYDTKKTLKENKEIIFEQSNPCANSMTYSELREKANDAGNIVKKMDSSLIRMAYRVERSNELYDIVKSLSGKNVLDDVTEECVNAMEKFVQNFKSTGSRKWLSSGFDLEKKINDFISGYYSDDEESKRYLNATLKLLNPKTTTIPVKKEDGKKEDGKKGGEDKKNKPNSTTPPTIPPELKDIEGVKKFQDWLDTNKAGWATGFPKGILSKGSGYGRFGPRTKAAWKYKDEFTTQVDSESVDDIIKQLT